jgi:hypothetical protein
MSHELVLVRRQRHAVRRVGARDGIDSSEPKLPRGFIEIPCRSTGRRLSRRPREGEGAENKGHPTRESEEEPRGAPHTSLPSTVPRTDHVNASTPS